MNSKYKILSLLLLIFAIVGSLTFFYGGCNEDTNIDKEYDKYLIKQEKIVLDSVKKENKIQDSIKKNINKSEEQIVKINSTKNEEINRWTIASSNEQFVFFSKWISQIDTIR